MVMSASFVTSWGVWRRPRSTFCPRLVWRLRGCRHPFLHGFAGEGVADPVELVNRHVGFSGCAEGVFEFLDVGGGGVGVVVAEDSEDGALEFFELFGVGDEGSVEDAGGFDARVGEGEEEGLLAAHAPADGGDVGGVDDAVGGFFGEKVEPVLHVEEGGFVFHGGFEDGGGFGVVGDFALIEVGRDGVEAVLGELAGAGLDVFVDAPPFLEDEETGGGVVFGEICGVGEVEAGFGFAVGGGAGEPAGFESAGDGGRGGGGWLLGLLGCVAVHSVVDILVVLVECAVEFAFFAVF